MTPTLSSDLAADLLARGHAARLRAGGGSMRPWIRPGTVVTLVPVNDPTQLRVGVVILAICDGRPMLHRIVRAAPRLQTKGDALGHLDPPPSAVLGRLEGSGGPLDRAVARLSLALLPLQSVLVRLAALLRSRHYRKIHDTTSFAEQMEAEAERHEVRTLARAVWLQAQLASFLRACAEAELPCIVLKGAALAETVYPRLGLRDFRDLDILVRPADAPRARAVLEALGYAADETHWHDVLTGDDCQADFARQSPGGPVVLELHTDLVNNDLLRDQIEAAGEGIWHRARQVTLAGVPAQVLGPEDQLLHLCLHLAGHHLAAPRSLRDILHVCVAQTINWTLLVQIARRSHITRIAYAGLWLAVRLMGASVPRAALSALAPWPLSGLLRRLALARAQDRGERRTAGLRLPLLLLLSDRPWRLPRLLLRLLFPSRRWLYDHYAPRQRSALLPVLYLAHVRSLLRGGKSE